MNGEVLRDGQWEKVTLFVPGGRKAFGSCRMMIRYQTIRMDNTALRERMRGITQERRRSG